MAWSGDNRRQFPRIAYPCLVRVMYKGHAPDILLAHTENISAGGMCVIVRKEVEMFAPTEVEIDLVEDPEHIFASGHVVWTVRRKATETVKPMFYDIGIQFDAMKDKDKARLQAAIDTFVKKGYKVLKPVH